MKAPELLPPSDTMYRALVNRDSSFEGIFFVGVRTTGIFCRPTCTAKKPARQNVDFFATPSEALHGGYRPCLRCNPMDPDKRPPKLIERLRAEVERTPGGRLTDKELAALSIDPSTARRQFKRHYGMTFQAYHRARRMGLALRDVRRGSSVDEAQNGSGFESASGFRDAFARIFGEPPTMAKQQGGLFAERIETPLGAMLAVADDEGLRLLEFADRRALEIREKVLGPEHPRTADSRVVISSSLWRERPRGERSRVPSSDLVARSRSEATLFADRPAPRTAPSERPRRSSGRTSSSSAASSRP